MKKKIEELFRLAMKAQEKTSAYVSFETSNHGFFALHLKEESLIGATA